MAQKPRMWLHVGPAKTGTTTIQHALRAGRDDLAKAGVLVPVLNDAARSLTASQHDFAKAVYEERFDWIRDRIDALPDFPDTVISSEWFTYIGRGREPRLARLAELLARRYDTHVVYYVRDPVARATSQAQQTVKGGTRRLADAMEKPRRYNLRRDLLELAGAFGKEALIVRAFSKDAFVDNDLLSDFCASIGRDGLFDHVDRGRKNEAMSLETAQAIDAHRRSTGDKSRIDPDDPRFLVPGGTRFVLPDAVVRQIREDTAGELKWLANTYGIDLR